MRLLLDEHYDRRIAELLRERGHDVVATTERADFVGLSDRDLLAAAGSERRALVTEDVRDFVQLLREHAASGTRHYGVVLVAPGAARRSKNTIGRFVDALHKLLDTHRAEDALHDDHQWLDVHD